MVWNHIVIEGHCFLKEHEPAPNCCQVKPGRVGYHCLAYDKGQYCPYFRFSKARSSLLLTDTKGEVIDFDSFFPDHGINLSEKDWLIEEQQWLINWKNKFK